MSVVIKPEELKELRLSKQISIKSAAESVERSFRTWQGYEAPKDLESHISIPSEIFNKFLRAHRMFWPSAKVVSVTAYKGGVGKSPITIAVAASFASKGFKVAVVTNDPVYRSYSESEKAGMKALGRAAALLDFYDESDVIMYAGETQRLKQAIEKNQQDASYLVCRDDIDTLSRKQASTMEFDELKKKYDVLFLDINRNLAQTLIKSDLVALLVDLSCPFAYSSTQSYCNKMRELNGGVMSAIYMLLTNLSPAPKFVGLCERETPEIDEMNELLVWRSDFGARNYKKLLELDVPYLRSRFSSDYEYRIDRYDDEQSAVENYFCYFDTVMDIAPHSLAAIEVLEVANELESLLWMHPD
ncbi:ParA family protein [Pseudomonas sp. B21-015]|uniref:ParA family protein n=1 Tax=Pseudomonas sp. B21-015 TaxID=2895473 RepID=UPI00215FC2C4|nr:ParA family protein [Pseudomonas sp. B21-015]UVM47715.1 ParA family protein [Pseudomonas sp. B21-015]